MRYIIRRILLTIPTLIAVSFISFLIIELPPGDFVDSYISQLEAQGELIEYGQKEALRARWGLDQPVQVRYWKWFRGLLHGDLGRSLQYEKSVFRLIAERVPWSFLISFASMIFVYVVAIPIGVTSATHQYTIRDYFFTFLGFIGVSVPNFLFALALLWAYFVYTGQVNIGLFSKEYILAPWSFAKLWDLLKHLWMPAIVVGTGSTCSLIRRMRANLLDELRKPYVIVARAKGLSETRLLYKYPFRIAINPLVSTIGWTLPALINGALLTSLVLGMPTIAPVFLNSLINKDMFLAGSIVFILSTLTVIGTLISDVLLAWVDPRIREAI